MFQIFQTPESFNSQLQLVDAGQTELPQAAGQVPLQPTPGNTQAAGEASLSVPPTQVSLFNLPSVDKLFLVSWFDINQSPPTDFLVLGICSVCHQFGPEVKVCAVIFRVNKTFWTLFDFSILLCAQKLKERTKRHPLWVYARER